MQRTSWFWCQCFSCGVRKGYIKSALHDRMDSRANIFCSSIQQPPTWIPSRSPIPSIWRMFSLQTLIWRRAFNIFRLRSLSKLISGRRYSCSYWLECLAANVFSLTVGFFQLSVSSMSSLIWIEVCSRLFLLAVYSYTKHGIVRKRWQRQNRWSWEWLRAERLAMGLGP